MSNTTKAKPAPVDTEAGAASPCPDDLDAWINDATPPQRTVELCVRGDLFVAHEDAHRRLAGMVRASQNRLGTPPDITSVRAEIAEIEAQMVASTRVFTFRALGPDESDDLVFAHPPRKDNEKDAAAGYNRSAVRDATIRACTLNPPMTAEQWDRLQPKLSAHQIDEAYTACNAVSYNKFSVPFSPAASVSSPSSGGDSKPLEPAGSAPASSPADPDGP